MQIEPNYEIWVYFVLMIIGIIIGLMATLGGIGGGVLIMPILLLWLEISPSTAKGTSLFMISMSTLVSSIIHYKNQKISLKFIIICSIFAIIGSLIMNYIQNLLILDKSIFFVIFGIFEVLISLRIILKIKNLMKEKKAKNDLENKEYEPKDNPNKVKFKDLPISNNSAEILKIAPLFLLSGAAVTFFGIGGGVINTPAMYSILNFPIHLATASSTGIIFFTSSYNSIIYAIQGNIDWVIGLIMGLGMIIGARTGAKLSDRIPKQYILGLLAILLLVASVQIILKGLI